VHIPEATDNEYILISNLCCCWLNLILKSA